MKLMTLECLMALITKIFNYSTSLSFPPMLGEAGTAWGKANNLRYTDFGAKS